MTTHEFDGPLGEDWKVFAPDDPDFNMPLTPIRLEPAPPGTWFVGYVVFGDGSASQYCAVQHSGHEVTEQHWCDTADEVQAFIREQRAAS